MDQDDDDDEFIGQCLIEGFAWSHAGEQDWSVRRERGPLESAASIGTRFRHCSAPPMLMLLAPRLALLFKDDDDDDEEEEDYANLFMRIFAYLRDYSSINRTELSANRSRTIDRCMETLGELESFFSYCC